MLAASRRTCENDLRESSFVSNIRRNLCSGILNTGSILEGIARDVELGKNKSCRSLLRTAQSQFGGKRQVMGEQKSVMVLDDEPIVGTRMKPVLEREGFSVEVFTDSSLALERLKQKTFSVLVTDMKMSGPSGMDILRFLKTSGVPTPVIVITGYATIETSHEAQALGACHFIAKPFKLKDLARLVMKASK